MEKQASDPKQWQVGTSTTLFTEFSKAELQECASAGITHIELVVSGPLLESDEGYRQLSARVDLIKEAGLQLWSVHLPFGKQWDTSSPDESFRTNIINIFAKAITFFAGLGASRAVIHPGYEHTPDPDRAARLKRTKEALHYLAHVGVDHGLTLAVECLPRTCLGNTSAEIQELLAGSDQLQICLDANHLLQEKTEEFIAKLGHRIVTVHMSDYDFVNERHWLPGTGINNWTAIISELAHSGYTGPFLFEVSRKNAGPFNAQDLVNCWKNLLGKYETDVQQKVG